MYLPEEVLDEIFNHLPADSRQSLQNCSLVSKSWLGPSRRLLFAHVTIRLDNCQSWLDKIPPTNTEILRHVRSLNYFQQPVGPALQSDITKDLYCRIEALRDYFPSFSRLQWLTLHDMIIRSPLLDRLRMFSAFKHTLSALAVTHLTIAWSAFVALVGYFPYIRCLEVEEVFFQDDDNPVPEISHPLRGGLCVDLFLGQSREIFASRFPKLKQEYEEIVALGTYEHRIAVANEETLKYLRISRYKLGAIPNLSGFRELRHLEILTMHPSQEDCIFISSITSTNFRKVSFSWPRPFRWEYFLDSSSWAPFDDVICELADRLRALGASHTIEVELLLRFEEFAEEEHCKMFLPRFKEKGRVRIVSTRNGEVREWP